MTADSLLLILCDKVKAYAKDRQMIDGQMVMPKFLYLGSQEQECFDELAARKTGAHLDHETDTRDFMGIEVITFADIPSHCEISH